MNTFPNPFEELFAALSVLYQLFNQAISGLMPLMQPCVTTANFDNCAVTYGIALVALIAMLVIFFCLWLFGYRIVVILYPITSFFTIAMYINFTQRDNNIFLQIALLMLLFVIVAILLDRYRPVFWLIAIAVIIGRIMFYLLNFPPLFGGIVGSLIGIYLSQNKELREKIDHAITAILILTTSFVGGIALLQLACIIAALAIGWLSGNTFDEPLSTYLLVLAVIIGIVLMLSSLRIIKTVIGYGIHFQFKTRAEQEKSAMPELPILRRIDSLAVYMIALIIILNAPLINITNPSQIPLDTARGGLEFLLTDYQIFADRLLRPWYLYPWDSIENQQEFHLLEAIPARTCPRLDCPVFNETILNYDFPTRTNAAGNSGGINAWGNYLGETNGDRVNGNERWYVFYHMGWTIIYLPADLIEVRELSAETD